MRVHPNMRAAEGWIELGNFDEAAEELHNSPPAVKSSVAFLKMWVRICEGLNRWDDLNDIANCWLHTRRTIHSQFSTRRRRSTGKGTAGRRSPRYNMRQAM